MKSRKSSRKEMLTLCAEVHSDDGVDPKKFFHKEQTRKNDNRKARQLCSQVADALSFALAGECRDDLLRSIYVAKVEPAPDSTRLLVTVGMQPDEATAPPETILVHLQRATGKLRCEVAAAIHRKRTPELTFRVLGPNESKGGDT